MELELLSEIDGIALQLTEETDVNEKIKLMSVLAASIQSFFVKSANDEKGKSGYKCSCDIYDDWGWINQEE